CQGRGSVANSAVCYCLGITEVDPARIEALFERFISKERHEPPDIDVDFERGPLSRLVPIENAAMEGRTVIEWDKTDLDALGLLKIDCLGLGMLSTMFSAGEAERLRRSMAIWRRHGGIEDFEARLIGGMRQRGYPESYARRIFEQIRGLGEYGFRSPMPRASRSWPVARPGSSATSPRPSPALFPLGETPALPDPVPMLRKPTEGEDIVADYGSLGLTLRRHPLALLRPALTRLSFQSAREVVGLTHGRSTHAAGLVITRQRPGTATGVMFLTLEDETGPLNVAASSSVSAASCSGRSS
ncbi:MAG: hypothetical protein LC647_18465, partial [Beggiatoa sp.]|nr:hypothetical protein [Beggiatoa sp.]